MWKIHFNDLCSKSFVSIDSFFDCVADLIVQSFAHQRARDAQTHPVEGLGGLANVVHDGNISRCGIVRVATGDCLQNDSRIRCLARKYSDLIQR